MLKSDSEHANSVGGDQEIMADVKSAKILVVDDMALMRKIIGSCLSKGGYENILYAEDGDQALNMVQEHNPDILILDLNMPKVSGYEVCRTLRSQSQYNGLPILVQSASETDEERVQVFASGATDFVSKPINQPELLARVRMHLENKFMIHSLSKFRQRMESELVMAREMQQTLLPERRVIREIEKLTNSTMESYYRASSELGGDLWGCWVLPENKIGIFVLDITGHGVGSALNTFRVHATMARFHKSRLDPAEFLTDLNRVLAPSFPLGQFATMFYGVLTCDTGEFVYAGAGSPHPMIISDNGIRLLDSSGYPVGIVKRPKYVNLYDSLMPGESLFCYSDVLVEAPVKDDQILGEEGLVQWVQEIVDKHERPEMVSKLLKRFFAVQSDLLPDDLTAIAIHRKG